MKKLWLLGLALLFTTSVWADWDSTKPDTTDTVADCLTDTQTNFDAINDILDTNLDADESGVLLPSGSIFFMLTGDCPTGTTDVTSTYEDKFFRAGTSAGSTGGSDTHNHGGSTGDHTLTISEIPSHKHDGIYAGLNMTGGSQDIVRGSATGTTSGLNMRSDSYTGTTGGGGSHNHSISSASNVPAHVECKICQVD